MSGTVPLGHFIRIYMIYVRLRPVELEHNYVLHHLTKGDTLQNCLRVLSEQNLNQNDRDVESWFQSIYESGSGVHGGQICRWLTYAHCFSKTISHPCTLCYNISVKPNEKKKKRRKRQND